MLRSRGGPIERAAARVCREAGATVVTHVLVRDLNVVPSRQDERRIEVIVNGCLKLPFGMGLGLPPMACKPCRRPHAFGSVTQPLSLRTLAAKGPDCESSCASSARPTRWRCSATARSSRSGVAGLAAELPSHIRSQPGPHAGAWLSGFEPYPPSQAPP